MAGILLLLPISDLAGHVFQAPLAWIVGALAVCISVLLVTTPLDAIKLRPHRSVNWIALGTVWLLGFQVLLIERAGLSAVGFLIATAIYAWVLVKCRSSPWWAVVLAWQPAFLGPLAVPLLWAASSMAVAAGVAGIVALRVRPELTS